MAAAEEAARLEEERLRVEEEVRVTALRLHCDCTGHSHCRLTCLSLLPTLGRGWGIVVLGPTLTALDWMGTEWLMGSVWSEGAHRSVWRRRQPRQ